jgi:hypothetical protein
MAPATSSTAIGEGVEHEDGEQATTPVALICLRKFEYENALLDEIVEAKLSPTRGVAALLGPKRTLHLVLLSAVQQSKPTPPAAFATNHQGKLVEGFLVHDVERCDLQFIHLFNDNYY